MKNYAFYPNKAKNLLLKIWFWQGICQQRWRFETNLAYSSIPYFKENVCDPDLCTGYYLRENFDVWVKGRHYVRWFGAAIARVFVALVMNSVSSSSKFRWLIVSFIWKLRGPRRIKLVLKIKIENHTCLVFRLVSSTSSQDSAIAKQ